MLGVWLLLTITHKWQVPEIPASVDLQVPRITDSLFGFPLIMLSLLGWSYLCIWLVFKYHVFWIAFNVVLIKLVLLYDTGAWSGGMLRNWQGCFYMFPNIWRIGLVFYITNPIKLYIDILYIYNCFVVPLLTAMVQKCMLLGIFYILVSLFPSIFAVRQCVDIPLTENKDNRFLTCQYTVMRWIIYLTYLDIGNGKIAHCTTGKHTDSYLS